MQELRLEQVEHINGGVVWSLPRLVMPDIGAYRTISSIDWGRASYSDMMIAP